MSGADKKLIEPLDKNKARKLVLEISADKSKIDFSHHAGLRGQERSIIMNDVLNVLKSPSARITKIEPANEHGQWKYNLDTTIMGFTFKFTQNFTRIFIITVYRKGRRS